MHEKEVLRTPKKHERIPEVNEESPLKSGSIKRSSQVTRSYGDLDSILSPQGRQGRCNYIYWSNLISYIQ